VYIVIKKIVAGIIAYRILYRLGKVYSRVQRMTYEGLGENGRRAGEVDEKAQLDITFAEYYDHLHKQSIKLKEL